MRPKYVEAVKDMNKSNKKTTAIYEIGNFWTLLLVRLVLGITLTRKAFTVSTVSTAAIDIERLRDIKDLCGLPRGK